VIILQANKFFFEKGGSERYMFALSGALTARGHQVVDFSMQDDRNLPSRYSHHFAPHRDYDARGVEALRAVPAFIRSRAAARRMSDLLDEVVPDVAHLHNIYHQLTPSIIAPLSRRGIPVVMTLHDYKLVCPSYTMFAKGAPCYRCRGGRFYQAALTACAGSRARSTFLALEAYWQRISRVYDRVDCFIAPSEYLCNIMRAAGVPAARIEYVPQLSPNPDNSVTMTGEETRVLDGLPGRFIAFVGRLSPEKGLAVLIDAVQRLRGIHLVVVGDGPQAGELRAECQARHLDHVTFVGHLGRAATERVIARCVALVIPSLWAENAPMVVLEAARAGTPVIGSNSGGLCELMERTAGLAVTPGNVDELARGIEQVWNDATARERAGRAWRLHGGVHEPAEHVAAIESVYTRAVTRTRAA
jgi:glycosyltransferase involved in cell wall biosynthesis